MEGSSHNGRANSKGGEPNDGKPAKGGKSPPPWRLPFDTVERPVTKASQSWLETKTFMDGLAIGWRLQRRARVEVRRGLGFWFAAWNLPTRGDVDRLSNQLANVERELRAVRAEVGRPEPEGLNLADAPARRRPASRGRL